MSKPNPIVERARLLRASLAAEIEAPILRPPKHEPPTPEFLRTVLSYDPDTGVFLWRERKDIRAETNRIFSGKVAGFISKAHGYRIIKIRNQGWRAHRVAWAIMTGAWPVQEIDHHNTIRSDNKWSNLRPATRGQNQQNRRINTKHSSGFKGVWWNPTERKWRAAISRDGGTRIIGRYSTAEEAHAAYCKEALRLFGDFANFGTRTESPAAPATGPMPPIQEQP